MSYLLVFFLGCILPLAFAPFGIYSFAFFAPAVLLYQWQKATPRQAFTLGGLFGLGFFGVGVSWVYISIHTYGAAPVWLASLITGAMILFMALFPATQGYLSVRCFGKKNNTLFCLAVFPATWVIWEWLRCLPFNGFPWLFLGYSQLATPLRGFAPYMGIYGVSLMVAVCCGCLVLICSRRFLSTKLIALLILGIMLLTGWQINKIQWTKTAGTPISVALVQANILQSIKWKPEEFANIVKTYEILTDPIWGTRLIIWPEAAIPAFTFQVADTLSQLNQLAQQKQSSLLLGILTANPLTEQYFNSVVLLGADQGEYRKRHLVAFGEYTPLSSLFSSLMHYWKIPMSNFTAGPSRQGGLTVSGIKISPFICYEIAFPNQVLQSAKNNQLIVNVSDDSWFGKSFAPAQQMEITRMRALETGQYALSAANTGITAIVDPHGEVIAALPAHQSGVLEGKVSAMDGHTPLVRWNYYPVVIIIIGFLLLAFLHRERRQ